ncbi:MULTISPECIES: copper-binding protein [Paenalcaligenes]|uniref:Copper-binding protein n=1 Tax=Paenalcaligenes hermetiae TaxID=1157987 RepID=A0ABP9M562_9BURK|nr:copper-binding protein [Paenalcaligenes sp.]
MSLLSTRHIAATIFALGTVAVVSPAIAQQGTATGEVRRIDAAAGKITLKHGSIDALELPGMTLVYLIDPALLGDIKPGDKVKFTAERRNGEYVVIKISK